MSALSRPVLHQSSRPKQPKGRGRHPRASSAYGTRTALYLYNTRTSKNCRRRNGHGQGGRARSRAEQSETVVSHEDPASNRSHSTLLQGAGMRRGPAAWPFRGCSVSTVLSRLAAESCLQGNRAGQRHQREQRSPPPPSLSFHHPPAWPSNVWVWDGSPSRGLAGIIGTRETGESE